jgi:hypothetical protein
MVPPPSTSITLVSLFLAFGLSCLVDKRYCLISLDTARLLNPFRAIK